ncbi:hypothetical protein FPV67DRAFT_1561395 [Lyophyllum atratum]|nr:hypothetical protein FPV67DRAFT_1561395 [Lyophyllum atratum]
MIILDEQDQQWSKQLQGPLSDGLTLRLPEKAAVRSDSPLPDYETSEARQKLITKEKLFKGVDPRLWRAILYALAIYLLLSLVIGLPIVLVKRHQHDMVDIGPPEWDNDPNLGASMSFSSSDTWILGDSAKCEWDEVGVHFPSPFTARVEHALNYSGSIYIRSNISTVASNSSFLDGHLTVDINPDTAASKLIFKVDVSASTEDLLHETTACFVSRQLRNLDFIKVDIRVLIPRKGPSKPLNNFVTYLPWFSQNFGDLRSRLIVKNLVIEGAGYDVVAESVNASKISVKNSYASIIGAFHATTTLSLDSIKGNIDTNITLERLRTAVSPVSLALDTGDGSYPLSAIDARITLLGSLPTFSPFPPCAFVADVKTFNGPLRLQAMHANATFHLPLQLTVQNTDGKTDVFLDKDYEGTYSVQSKLGNVYVQKPNLPSSMDPRGKGRARTYQSGQQTSHQITGWVGWGKPPIYGSSVAQGQVKIRTSLSPIMLQLGSATGS